jgi:hypothetical protein
MRSDAGCVPTFGAARCLSADTVEAFTACCVERHDDLACTVSVLVHREHRFLNITFPPVESSSSLRRPSLSSLELAYLVSNVELLHIVSLLHDLADELVAADEVGRALQVSAVEMQVAAAEGCGRDF